MANTSYIPICSVELKHFLHAVIELFDYSYSSVRSVTTFTLSGDADECLFVNYFNQITGGDELPESSLLRNIQVNEHVFLSFVRYNSKQLQWRE